MDYLVHCIPIFVDSFELAQTEVLALIKLGQHQPSATESTNKAIVQLLDYVATYPNYGFTFSSSSMILAGHSDAAYLNFRKSCRRAGAHIMLYENILFPNINGTVILTEKIIKFVMS